MLTVQSAACWISPWLDRSQSCVPLEFAIMIKGSESVFYLIWVFFIFCLFCSKSLEWSRRQDSKKKRKIKVSRKQKGLGSSESQPLGSNSSQIIYLKPTWEFVLESLREEPDSWTSTANCHWHSIYETIKWHLTSLTETSFIRLEGWL